MPEKLTPLLSVLPDDPVSVIDIEAPDRQPVRAAGLDLVDVDRLRLAVHRSGPRLLHRLFDERERDACADGADFVAMARLFGIKESIVKVVGGLPRGAAYRDMSIDVDASAGLPAGHGAQVPVRLAGMLADWMAAHRTGAITAGGTATAEGVVLAWALALGGQEPC